MRLLCAAYLAGRYNCFLQGCNRVYPIQSADCGSPQSHRGNQTKAGSSILELLISPIIIYNGHKAQSDTECKGSVIVLVLCTLLFLISVMVLASKQRYNGQLWADTRQKNGKWWNCTLKSRGKVKQRGPSLCVVNLWNLTLALNDVLKINKKKEERKVGFWKWWHVADDVLLWKDFLYLNQGWATSQWCGMLVNTQERETQADLYIALLITQ